MSAHVLLTRAWALCYEVATIGSIRTAVKSPDLKDYR